MMNNAWKLNETGPTQASGRYGSPFRPHSGAPTAFTGGALKTTSSSYGNQGTGGSNYINTGDVNDILFKFRERLVARGARGFIGLQR
jgi:hypothetical protein